MRDQCHGTGSTPAHTSTVQMPTRSRQIEVRPVVLWSCRTCGWWVGLNRDGRLRAHVDWNRRKA